MHACLDLDEIVAIICSFLSKEDLLSVGLTCRHFKEPALRTLWKDLPNLCPFVKLLPEDAWQQNLIQDFRRNRTVLTLRRPINSSDLAKTRAYASCVRSLRISYLECIHTDIIDSAAHASSGMDIFPCLRVLEIYYPGDSGSWLNFANNLLTPHLTHFKLFIDHPQAKMKQVITTISQLATNCPSIISFKFSWHDYSDVLEVLSLAVCGWSSLRVLDVLGLNLNLTPKIMSHLSKLDHFEDLRCYSPLTNLTPGFTSLRKLYFDTQPMHNVLYFIRTLQSSVLEDLSVDLEIPATPKEWQEFFNVVSRRSSEAEELNLTLAGNYPYDRIQDDCVLKADTLRPLLLARNLVILNLADFSHFLLYDDFIEELAMASPRLTMLDIGTSNETLFPTLTLRAYLHALKHCPKLETLGLAVDTTSAREILEEISADGEVQRRTKWLELRVGSSLVGWRKSMAAFLFAIFERVNIVTFDGLDYEDSSEWARVRYLFQRRVEGAKDWDELDSEDESGEGYCC